MPLRNGRRHGVVRVWHKNGVLANEERYQNGLLHGVCRQWNEAGRLLGKYRMVSRHGCSAHLAREWPVAVGIFHCERRLFRTLSLSVLDDGRGLMSEDIFLHGKPVTAEAYHAARAKDKSLPKLTGKAGK